MMEKGFTALKNGTWEEYKETSRKKMKASQWAFDRIKEAFELVARDEAEKMSIVQEIMLRNTDCLRRIRTRRSHNVISAPKLQQFPSGRLRFCGSLEEKPQSGGAQFVEKSTTGGNRPGSLVVQTGESFELAKVFKVHAVPQGLCENLINALKLLANQ